jgi:hypothetical protein
MVQRFLSGIARIAERLIFLSQESITNHGRRNHLSVIVINVTPRLLSEKIEPLILGWILV